MSVVMSESANDEPARSLTEIAEYSTTAYSLAALRNALGNVVFDCKSTAGDKAAREARLKCVKLRTGLEQLRKDAKAEHLKAGRLIDSEAQRITVEIEAVEKPIDEQIKAEEKRKADEKAEAARIAAARKAEIDESINGIRAQAVLLVGSPARLMQVARDLMAAEQYTATKFDDRVQEAEDARTLALARLNKMIENALASEEQGRQVKAQLERNAAEAQRLAAERASVEAREANVRLERAALDAEKVPPPAPPAPAPVVAHVPDFQPWPLPVTIVGSGLSDVEQIRARMQAAPQDAKVILDSVETIERGYPPPAPDEIINVLVAHFEEPRAQVLRWLESTDWGSLS